MEESFVFILSIIDYVDDTPFEILPNHFLKKANNNQIRKIKELISSFNPNLTKWYPYEYSIVGKYDKKTNQTNFKRTLLPSKEWKYWIISFEGYNDKIQDLKLSFSLQKNEVELGFIIINAGAIEAFTYDTELIVNYFIDPEFSNKTITKININDLIQTKETYQLLNKLDTKYNHIKSSLARFGTINRISRNSELYIIGLFSIIESLITHSPKFIELSDSLTHQISSKMNLLLKRSIRNMDYKYFFDDTTEKNIWKKLYDYRSRIVHGEQIDFKSDLQCLKDKKNVILFLREIVKLLLLLAINDPQLVTDLKRC